MVSGGKKAMNKDKIAENKLPGATKKNITRPPIVEEITNGATINARGLFVIVICYLFMTFTAISCLLTRILLLGRGENFCRMYIIKPVFRLFFIIVGMKISYPEKKYTGEQVIYTLNHSSTLDNFLIAAMGLSDTRYFLSWPHTYKVIPLTITSLLQGTFYTPSQTDRSARVRCFQNAEKILKKTGYSAILSPEGTRVCTGEIGPFNKGTFHLATNLKIPIVPVYFYIPHHVNSWATFYIKPGHVAIDLLPMVDTSDWTLDRLDEQRESVRKMYVKHHQKRHQNDTWH
jgi:1-acyl-sn-glycerol-3-phosphate acyltransferase